MVTLTKHSLYPHFPGHLPGCPACDAVCHCTPEFDGCAYVGHDNEAN